MAIPAAGIRPAQQKRSFVQNISDHKGLYLMLLPGIVFFLIFCYGPMYGLIISFQDYYPLKGIRGSEWVGLKHFERIFSDPFFLRVLRNTLLISFYQLLFSFPMPIILCLALNEVHHVRFKKFAQSISYLPHFFSWVVLAGVVIEFLSPSRGPVNILLKSLGLEPVFFLGDPKWFRSILVLTDIWKGVGWGSIVYLAAVSGVDPQLYEAAEMDGAGRFKKILHVTLPSLMPIVTVMFIMQSGKILNDSFQQVYNLMNPTLYEVGDVISTFVYRMGLEKMQYSFSTAVGLFKNIISLILVVLTNYVSRKTSDYALW